MPNLSWVLVGVSILLSALSLIPTREGLVLFATNAICVALVRITARRRL